MSRTRGAILAVYRRRCAIRVAANLPTANGTPMRTCVGGLCCRSGLPSSLIWSHGGTVVHAGNGSAAQQKSGGPSAARIQGFAISCGFDDNPRRCRDIADRQPASGTVGLFAFDPWTMFGRRRPSGRHRSLRVRRWSTPWMRRGHLVSGVGSAELLDGGSIEIEFTYRNGDEAVLKAKRQTSSTAC
jgi:hypothetical protein